LSGCSELGELEFGLSIQKGEEIEVGMGGEKSPDVRSVLVKFR
jgi:hypothetical protein